MREYAETPDRFSLIADDSSVERFADERVCILQGPTWASVSGISVGAAEVEALLADVRVRVPADKEPVWWIASSARPADVYERLQALGLKEPRDRVSLVHGLVMTDEPAGPEDIEVARIETFEHFVAARELQWESRSGSWPCSTAGRRAWRWRSPPTAACS